MATPQTLFPQGSCWRMSALGAAISCALLAQPAQAQLPAPGTGAVSVHTAFDIPAQQLRQALLVFSQQTGQNVMLDGNLDAGLRSAPVKGSYSADQALAQLLAGSGFTFGRSDASTLYLVPLPDSAGNNIELGATTINSAWSLGSTTEGSGSYTTGQTSTATRLDMSLRKTPQSISVITRQQMDDQGLNNLSEVMQQTPGITVNRENSEGFTFYSRGFEIQNFQYDGVPSLSTDAGNLRDNYSITNSVIYDRVEVLKGATGLVNGIGYPSGVINLVRKRPTAQFQGHVSAGAGSWDHYRTELDVSGPLLDSGALRGRFVAAREQQHTFIDYQKQQQDIFYGVLDGDLSDATVLSVGYEYQQNDNDASSTTHLPAFYKNGTPVRFSLVDDDSTVRTLTATLLESFGLKVVQARNGPDALNMLSPEIDLLLTDYAMPGMTGGELAALVKRSYPQLPVVFVTGYANTDVLGLSHSTVIQKPFSERDLRSKIWAALAR